MPRNNKYRSTICLCFHIESIVRRTGKRPDNDVTSLSAPNEGINLLWCTLQNVINPGARRIDDGTNGNLALGPVAIYILE